MNIKFLVPSVLALSVLAVPALAQNYTYSYGDRPITGSQLTDRPSQRSNVTRSGSFLQPKANFFVRDYDYDAQRAYEQGYRQGYSDRGYDDR